MENLLVTKSSDFNW